MRFNGGRGGDYARGEGEGGDCTGGGEVTARGRGEGEGRGLCSGKGGGEGIMHGEGERGGDYAQGDYEIYYYYIYPLLCGVNLLAARLTLFSAFEAITTRSA